MTSPTFRDDVGTTSSNTSDPRSYVPVIEPLTMTYRSQPRRLGAISSAPSAKPAATSSAAITLPTRRASIRSGGGAVRPYYAAFQVNSAVALLPCSVLPAVASRSTGKSYLWAAPAPKLPSVMPEPMADTVPPYLLLSSAPPAPPQTASAPQSLTERFSLPAIGLLESASTRSVLLSVKSPASEPVLVIVTWPVWAGPPGLRFDA